MPPTLGRLDSGVKEADVAALDETVHGPALAPLEPFVAEVDEAAARRSLRHWHVRPRYGLLGMLMGWWRVKISSGCPLAA